MLNKNNSRPLPYVNYRCPLTVTDLEFVGRTISYEIQKRTQILSQYGIISNVNTLDANSPLMVVQSNKNSILVSKGSAVTPEGNVVSSYEDTDLGVPTYDDEYVIFIEYDLVGTDTRLTRYSNYEPSLYNRLEDTKETQISEYDVNTVTCEKGKQTNPIKIDRTSNLIKIQLYPLARLNNIVKLGTVIKTEQENETVFLITLDGEGLRPWFSAYDLFHRSMIGSGLVTDKNIHGLAISDFTVGNLTLFDMIQDRGLVISKDVYFPQYSGREVTIQITHSFITENSGNIIFKPVDNPKKKQNGTYGINIKPFKIGYIYADGYPGTQFPFTYDFQKGLLQITGYEAQWSKYNIVAYVVDALTPLNPTEMAINGIKVLPPSKDEIIITGGIAINAISNDTISFDGNVLQNEFRCYIDEDGKTFSNPAILGKFSLANIDENEEQTLTASNFGVSKIGIGVKTNGVPNFAIEIKGTFEDGSEGTDVIAVQNPLLINYSINYFTAISSWKLVQNGSNALSIPEDSQMMIYSYRNWDTRRRYTEICTVSHKGSDSEIEVKDVRNIFHNLNPVRPIINPHPIPYGWSIIIFENSINLRFAHTENKLLFDGAIDNTIYKYESRMLHIPTPEQIQLTIYVQQNHEFSTEDIWWESYTAPGNFDSSILFDWTQIGGGISQGTLIIAGKQYGKLHIRGSFYNYTLAYLRFEQS